MCGGQNKFATKAHSQSNKSITCRSTGDLLGWCRSTFSSMRSGKKTGVNATHFTRPLRPLSPLTHDMRRSHQISPDLTRSHPHWSLLAVAPFVSLQRRMNCKKQNLPQGEGSHSRDSTHSRLSVAPCRTNERILVGF